MNPLALPVGTILTVELGTRPATDDTVTLERTPRGFIERDYHCIDCAAVWEENGGVLAATHSGSHMLDVVPSLLVEDGPWKVDAVPAEWLREHIRGLLDSLDEHVTLDDVHAALSVLAVDAGLS